MVVTSPPFGKKSEIADDLRSALGQIEDVLGDLEQRVDAEGLEESGTR